MTIDNIKVIQSHTGEQSTYNLRFGCKVEVQYVVRYERYGEVEDEKAGR